MTATMRLRPLVQTRHRNAKVLITVHDYASMTTNPWISSRVLYLA
jgi:hypothetical protein